MESNSNATIRLSKILVDPFDRQKRITGWDQAALQRASILVIGAGALGNEVCKNLAQCGIGEIAIVDHDYVEPTNLNRCIFFRSSDLNKPKAEILAERINVAFPDTKALPYCVKCEALDGMIYANMDLIVSCVDNIDTRLTINRHCMFYNKPLVDGGTNGFHGRVQTIIPPASACLDCRWRNLGQALARQRHQCGRDVEIFERTLPALGITTSTVAAIQANEVVKLLHSLQISRTHTSRTIASNTLVDKMWIIDLEANTFDINVVRRDPECPYHDNFGDF
jgi:molybdopterin/thiamine biosynthesis adenylyltransferase